MNRSKRYELRYVYLRGVIAQTDRIHDLFADVVATIRLGRSVLVFDNLRKRIIKEEDLLKILGIKYDD